MTLLWLSFQEVQYPAPSHCTLRKHQCCSQSVKTALGHLCKAAASHIETNQPPFKTSSIFSNIRGIWRETRRTAYGQISVDQPFISAQVFPPQTGFALLFSINIMDSFPVAINSDTSQDEASFRDNLQTKEGPAPTTLNSTTEMTVSTLAKTEHPFKSANCFL